MTNIRIYNKTKKQAKVSNIEKVFSHVYADAVCSLDYTKDYELLFSTIMAAQCTDARVNIVTQTLYKKYPTLESFAIASLDELMDDIRSTGFFRNKSKNIVICANQLLDVHGGKVPGTMEELTKLAGVGRKTANIILGDIYNLPAVPADTHCIRISGKIGLTKQTDPTKVEMELKQIIKPEYQRDFCHQIVFHGRAICNARNPKCDICPIIMYCDYGSGVK